MKRSILEICTKANLEEAREHFHDLIIQIDKMSHLTAAKKFELQMMASCALMVEEFLIKDDVEFNFDFVSDYVSELKETTKCPTP